MKSRYLRAFFNLPQRYPCMSEIQESSPMQQQCKNCGTSFEGKFCPQCGQSVKEFQQPVQALFYDFVGNMFAFDTRFWKTLSAVLLKPGRLALDFVRGKRVVYMPPFRFYLFVSFIFFLLLNNYSTQLARKTVNSEVAVSWMEPSNQEEIQQVLDSIPEAKGMQFNTQNWEQEAEDLSFLKEHPEILIKQWYTNISWGMFLLMPVYALLLWLFHRKYQRFYVTHFVLAINQHAFAFVVLSIMLALALWWPGVARITGFYPLLLLPVYCIVGYRRLFQQKYWKSILKFLLIGFIYSILVLLLTAGSVVLALAQSGFGD